MGQINPGVTRALFNPFKPDMTSFLNGGGSSWTLPAQGGPKSVIDTSKRDDENADVLRESNPLRFSLKGPLGKKNDLFHVNKTDAVISIFFFLILI